MDSNIETEEKQPAYEERPEHHHEDRRKVKIIGHLDLFLTISTVAYLVLITLWPYILSNPENGLKLETSLKNEKQTKKELFTEECIFLAFVLLVGLVVVLTAIVLIQCVHPKTSKSEAVKMSQFWVYCTLGSLVATFFAIQYTGLQYIQNEGPLPVPCMVYFVFKFVALYVIRWRTNLTVAETELTYKPMPGIIPGESAAPKPPAYMNYWKCRTHVIKNYEFAPTMDLKPYRGKGLGVPQCQCLAPQCRD